MRQTHPAGSAARVIRGGTPLRRDWRTDESHHGTKATEGWAQAVLAATASSSSARVNKKKEKKKKKKSSSSRGRGEGKGDAERKQCGVEQEEMTLISVAGLRGGG